MYQQQYQMEGLPPLPQLPNGHDLNLPPLNMPEIPLNALLKSDPAGLDFMSQGIRMTIGWL